MYHTYNSKIMTAIRQCSIASGVGNRKRSKKNSQISLTTGLGSVGPGMRGGVSSNTKYCSSVEYM